MSVDVDAARARAEAIWTDENWAELERRRQRDGGRYYPTPDDLAWLRGLGVYDVPRDGRWFSPGVPPWQMLSDRPTVLGTPAAPATDGEVAA